MSLSSSRQPEGVHRAGQARSPGEGKRPPQDRYQDALRGAALEQFVETNDPDFKLNNIYTSRYARLIMEAGARPGGDLRHAGSQELIVKHNLEAYRLPNQPRPPAP